MPLPSRYLSAMSSTLPKPSMATFSLPGFAFAALTTSLQVLNGLSFLTSSAEGWRIITEAAEGAGRDPGEISILYPHWIEVVESDEDRRACEAGLQRFFPGSYDEGRATYLIGTAEEIAERVREHTARLPRVDGFLFTTICERPEQLQVISERLRPLLEIA